MTDNILTDPQSLNTHIRPTWCPGCGNFSIWFAIKQAISHLHVAHENVVLVYDVGCSGNMADFIKGYGFHALHGRAIPPASGIKLANPKLTVIVVIGDGGGYGEGLTHFINEMRGNHDITVLVHNNHRYSLTTGQMSPTTPKGTKTPSTPTGSIENPLNPISLSLSAGATFIARGFAVHMPQLTDMIVKAVTHPGFSVIDILQPCLVFNPEMDTKWYMDNMIDIESEGHKPNNMESALKQAIRTDKIPTGIFWKDDQSVPYHKQDKIASLHTLSTNYSVDITSLAKKFSV